jgi:sec-independent protein translocase protein TatC
MASGFLERRSSGKAEMSFVDHLEELRWHIVRSVIVILILAVYIFIEREWVFDNIIAGPINPNFVSYTALCDFSHWLGIGNTLCLPPISVTMQTTTFGLAHLVLHL